MQARFIIFISILTLVLAGASIYVARRFIAASPWGAAHRGVIWFTVAAFLVLELSAPFLYRTLPTRTNWSFVIQWITYTTLGLFVSMFLYTLVADAGVALWTWLFKGPTDLGRRAFFGVGALSLGSVTIGAVQAFMGPKVYEISIPIKNLPPEFDGFHIVQVSDLHIGPILQRGFAEKVVKMTQDLRPDLIALTGDFVDCDASIMADELDALRNLKAPHGVYFVTGNHEYYWDAPAWTKVMSRLGATVLENEHVVLTRGQGRVVLAGVPDLSADRFPPAMKSDPAQAIAGAPEGMPRILLAHQPASYRAASKAGFDLQLSGHTHGGQFFPWSILVAITQKYYKGLNRHEKMWVYVNRGTGFWGPPMRFAISSEISSIRLTRA